MLEDTMTSVLRLDEVVLGMKHLPNVYYRQQQWKVK